ncbi:MAG: hypothetical protein IJO04_02185 [Oscillospiraceae bacterium]|nr:hypothetical protein [Oscillospiraceae bacterium]
MDTAQKRFPSFRPVDLLYSVLLVQRDIAGDIHLRITGSAVTVPSRKEERINIQIVEHIFNRYLAVEFLKYQHILSVISVKGNTSRCPLIGDPADGFRIVLLVDSVVENPEN